MAAKTDSADAPDTSSTQPGPYQATFSDEDRKAGYILVKLGPKAKVVGATLRGDAWSIFHEFDDQHPNDPGMGGELLVVAGKVVKAYPTAGVMRAIGSKFLEQVDAQKAPVHDTPPNLIDIPAVGAAPAQNPPAVVAVPAIVAANNATLAPEDSAGAPAPDAPASSSSKSSK